MVPNHGNERTTESIGTFIDTAADLLVRCLSDRADMSAPAAFVLNRIERQGPMRVTTLAATEGVSQPSMTQLVQRLERRGLVEKVADPHDGRVALIGIADGGRKLLADRLDARRARLAQILSTLSPDERDALALSARVGSPVLQRLAASSVGHTDAADGQPDDERGHA